MQPVYCIQSELNYTAPPAVVTTPWACGLNPNNGHLAFTTNSNRLPFDMEHNIMSGNFKILISFCSQNL